MSIRSSYELEKKRLISVLGDNQVNQKDKDLALRQFYDFSQSQLKISPLEDALNKFRGNIFLGIIIMFFIFNGFVLLVIALGFLSDLTPWKIKMDTVVMKTPVLVALITATVAQTAGAFIVLTQAVSKEKKSP